MFNRKTSNRSLEEFSKHHLKHLKSNFTLLKHNWKKLQGGIKRSEFQINNSKRNMIISTDEADFKQAETNMNELNNDLNVEETIEQKSSFEIDSQSKANSKSIKRWTKYNPKIRRKMRSKVQEILNKTNHLLNGFGLSFTKIELGYSSVNNYNYTFKLKGGVSK